MISLLMMLGNMTDTTDLSDDFLDVSTADIANILDGFSSQSLPTIDLDINVVRHRIISYRKMVSSGPIPWRAKHLQNLVGKPNDINVKGVVNLLLSI